MKIKNYLLYKNDSFLVALFLILIYFLITLSFGYLQNLETIIYKSPDTTTYKAVGDWIWGEGDTIYTISRPFLYPFILKLALILGGIYGVWIMQFLFWLIAGILIYKSISLITSSKILKTSAVIIYSTNFTLMLITLHALTESLSVFLISILVYFFVKQLYTKDNKYLWGIIILVTSLLTIIKPTFQYILVLILLYRFIIIIKNPKNSYNLIKRFVLVIILISPVIIQLSIMVHKHDEFTISKIGINTFQKYFLTRVYSEINDISLSQSREILITYDKKQMFEFLINNLSTSLYVFSKDILENLLRGSSYTDIPNKNIFLTLFMKIINKIYFLLHLIILLPFYKVLKNGFKNNNWENVKLIFYLSLPFLFLIITSGITWGQGDRILSPTLPIWLVLYTFVLERYFIISGKKLNGF